MLDGKVTEEGADDPAIPNLAEIVAAEKDRRDQARKISRARDNSQREPRIRGFDKRSEPPAYEDDGIEPTTYSTADHLDHMGFTHNEISMMSVAYRRVNHKGAEINLIREGLLTFDDYQPTTRTSPNDTGRYLRADFAAYLIVLGSTIEQSGMSVANGYMERHDKNGLVRAAASWVDKLRGKVDRLPQGERAAAQAQINLYESCIKELEPKYEIFRERPVSTEHRL